MVDFILLLALTSLWIWGVHGFFQLTNLANILDDPKLSIPYWLRKPLFDCPPCCASIHGTIAFILFHHDLNILLWPIFVFCLCGLNYIIKEHLYES